MRSKFDLDAYVCSDFYLDALSSDESTNQDVDCEQYFKNVIVSGESVSVGTATPTVVGEKAISTAESTYESTATDEVGACHRDQVMQEILSLHDPIPASALQEEDSLGGGAYGVVKKGRLLLEDSEEEQVVCWKKANVEVEGLKQLEKFAREAKLLRLMAGPPAHPYCLSSLGVSVLPGKAGLALVTEFLSGGNLDFRGLKEQLPLGEALRIGVQLCEAVAHCHGLGVLHGDIKPANILLTAPLSEHPDIRLADFGESHFPLIAKKEKSVVTPGSVSYNAPEILRKESQTTASDVYSLGCVLFQLITHKELARSNDSLARRAAGDGLPAKHLRRRLGEYPKLLALLLACWDNKPKNRPTASELSTELQAIAQAHGCPVEGIAQVEPPSAFAQAVVERNSEAIKRLLASEQANDLKTECFAFGATALHLLAVLPSWYKPLQAEDDTAQAIALIELLLDHGFDINAKDTFGQTPLSLATTQKQKSIMVSLLKHGAEPGEDKQTHPLFIAARRGFVDMLDVLLAEHVDPNLSFVSGDTALHVAARYGQGEAVACLLRHGARLDVRNTLGQTAQQLAAIRGHQEVSQLLLSQGASVGLSTQDAQAYWDAQMDLYIPSQVQCCFTQGVEIPTSEHQSRDLQTFLNDYLKGPSGGVLLLTGEGGAGKSLSLKILERRLKETSDIPVYRIALNQYTQETMGGSVQDTLANHYHETPEAIQYIQQNPVILLCDGYDECNSRANLYRANGLYEWAEVWVIISCRTDYLQQIAGDGEHRRTFIPENGQAEQFPERFIQAQVKAFTKAEQGEYLNQYVRKNPDGLSLEDYESALREVSQLRELVSNPFMLTIFVKAWPYLLQQSTQFNASTGDRSHITRSDLYEAFLLQWFTTQAQKLAEVGQLPPGWDAVSEYFSYAKALAFSLYREGKVGIAYSPVQNKSEAQANATQISPWEQFFSETDEAIQLRRQGCPLSQSGNRYEFWHKTLFEYCASRYILDACRDNQVQELAITPKLLRIERGVMAFYIEQIESNPQLENRLWKLVDATKAENASKAVQQAGAVAATLLVTSLKNFSGRDCQHIKIPHAECQGGFFDYADFQGANLSYVNFSGSFLSYTNFSGANLTGCRLGQAAFFRFEASAQSVCYSSDKRHLAIAAGSVIFIVDGITRAVVNSLKGHEDNVTSVCYSPDGMRLVSGSNDATVRQWDLESGQLLTLSKHEGAVTSVTYSPDGMCLASGSEDKTVRQWDASNGIEMWMNSEHQEAVTSVSYSQNRLHLASGSKDKTVRQWYVENGTLFKLSCGHEKAVTSVIYSLDGAYLASGSEDKTVRQWKASDGSLWTVSRGHEEGVRSVTYSPDSRRLASGSWDATVCQWEVEGGALLTVSRGHEDNIYSVNYNWDGTLLASGSNDATVRQWQVEDGVLLTVSRGHEGWVNSVTFSPDGTRLASGSMDKTVRQWEVASGMPLVVSRGHEKVVTSLSYNPNGDRLASGSWDTTVRQWRVEDGKFLKVSKGHKDPVRSVSYNKDSTHLASGSLDKMVCQWEVESGDLLKSIPAHEDWVNSVSYSGVDSWRLASGGRDSIVYQWQIETGDLLTRSVGHKDWVRSVSYSSDGERLASGSNDATVRQWRVEDGTPLTVSCGHKTWVRSVSYSRDGTLLASGGWDNRVCQWRVSNDCLISIEDESGVLPSQVMLCLTEIPFVGGSQSVAYGKDNQLAVGCGDGSVSVWQTVIHSGETILQCQWRTHAASRLLTTGCQYQDALGLSAENAIVLQQHGIDYDEVIPMPKDLVSTDSEVAITTVEINRGENSTGGTGEATASLAQLRTSLTLFQPAESRQSLELSGIGGGQPSEIPKT